MALTWDATRLGPSITLSNGNKTASVTAGVPTGAFGSTVLVGKVYFEILIDNLAVNNGTGGLGIADHNFVLTTTGGVGTDTIPASIGVGPGGGNWFANNGGQAQTSNAWVVNAVVQFAVDVPNQLIWTAVNGGNWNAVAATPTSSGQDWSFLQSATYFPVFSESATGSNWTINGGATAFAFTPPTGFTGVDSSVVTGTLTVDHCVFSAANITATGITDGGSNVFSQTPSVIFVTPPSLPNPFSIEFSQEFGGGHGGIDTRIAGGSPAINTGVTDSTDIASADDIRGISRPQGVAWDIGMFEFVSASPLPRALIQTQNYPLAHPYPVLRGGLIPAVVNPPGKRLIQQFQEYPASHPYPRLSPSIAGATVKQAYPHIIQTQEQPSQPASVLKSGVSGPNVKNAFPLIFGRQETPRNAAAVFSTGAIPVQVATTVGAVKPVQYQWWNLQPLMVSPLQFQNVRPPVQDVMVGRQQQPDLLQPILGAGIAPQASRSPVADSVLGRQQQPDHPSSIMASHPVKNTLQPGALQIAVRQQLPDHPPSSQFWTYPPTSIPQTTSPGIAVHHAQDQERPSHPSSLMQGGVQGPNVLVPGGYQISVRQEQPGWIQPVATAGPYGQVLVVPVTSTLVIRQEQPVQPPSFVQFGRQGPNVLSPGKRLIQQFQEQPAQPLPIMSTGSLQVSTRAPGADQAIVRQEVPSQPPSFLQSGVQGPDVQVPVSSALVARQQLPDQPSSMVRTQHIVGNSLPPSVAGTVIIRQQQPDQPSAMFVSGIATTTFLPAVQRSLFIRQEMPYHPSTTIAGGSGAGGSSIPSNRPFKIGRRIRLRRDF